jgi:hypothetical protein
MYLNLVLMLKVNIIYFKVMMLPGAWKEYHVRVHFNLDLLLQWRIWLPHLHLHLLYHLLNHLHPRLLNRHHPLHQLKHQIFRVWYSKVIMLY